MADIVFAIGARFAEYSVDLIVHEFRYCFCSDNIRTDFKRQRELLAAKQETVQQQITEAKMNAESIEKDVESWMEQACKLIQELDDLENRRGNLGRSFSPWRKYHISKKMSRKRMEMIELLDRGKFEIFSRPTALPRIEFFAYRNYRRFQATDSAFDEIMKAIEDDNTLMVGLYGMGGSGKTTLVKEVGRKAIDSPKFDLVLFTTVSQTPDIRKIQGEIADLLGMRLDEETEIGRARRIHMRLKARNRILLILDDVWGRLNLQDIGVPEGCKILLTTLLETTCSSMNCQKKILLGLLSEEESWSFFQHHAQIEPDRPSWLREDMARNIARECNGLPIAIEAVGTTLKGKSFHDWKVALCRLKQSKPMDVEDGVRDAFTCLQLSYDYLRNEMAESLFLMCGLFPEDHDIFMEDLFRYGMGLGLCEETELEIARSEVGVGINKLIASCLLTHSHKGNSFFKMHDIDRS